MGANIMYDLSKHPYFEEYIDSKTGVKSYILTERVGFAQQHFYFTNTSLMAQYIIL